MTRRGFAECAVPTLLIFSRRASGVAKVFTFLPIIITLWCGPFASGDGTVFSLNCSSRQPFFPPAYLTFFFTDVSLVKTEPTFQATDVDYWTHVSLSNKITDKFPPRETTLCFRVASETEPSPLIGCWCANSAHEDFGDEPLLYRLCSVRLFSSYETEWTLDYVKLLTVDTSLAILW